ncbi:MAG: cytochrome c3 family protein [Acidobacteria bacterium]|nr:cytochrome c3 family protein [Acidobacteriota bacterium]
MFRMRLPPHPGWRATALIVAALACLLAASGATLRSSQPAAGAPAAGATPSIAFSHETHVNTAGLDCQFCHAYARRGPLAGLPPLSRCAGCHRFVLPDSPDVARLLARFDAGEPLAWPRVHDLPDHVRFTHKRHVRAGIACGACHGDVGRMQLAEQTAPLTMGWCVSCHEARQAPIDCVTCHY